VFGAGEGEEPKVKVEAMLIERVRRDLGMKVEHTLVWCVRRL
jgi:hypothetical protein